MLLRIDTKSKYYLKNEFIIINFNISLSEKTVITNTIYNMISRIYRKLKN